MNGRKVGASLPLSVVSKVLGRKLNGAGSRGRCKQDNGQNRRSPTSDARPEDKALEGAVQLVFMGAPLGLASKQYKVSKRAILEGLKKTRSGVPRHVEEELSSDTNSEASSLPPPTIETPVPTKDHLYTNNAKTMETTQQQQEESFVVVSASEYKRQTSSGGQPNLEQGGDDNAIILQHMDYDDRVEVVTLEACHESSEALTYNDLPLAISQGPDPQLEANETAAEVAEPSEGVTDMTVSQGNTPETPSKAQNLEAAKNLVMRGHSMTEACRQYGIAYDTLRDSIIRGPKAAQRERLNLTAKDEEELKAHILELRQSGQAVSVEWVRNVAAELARKRGRPFTGGGGLPSYNWWQRFKKRHPELVGAVPRIVEAISHQIPPEKRGYRSFREARETLESLGVLDRPDRIYVVSECCVGGGEDCHKNRAIFPKAGQGVPFTEHVTFTHCAGASGQWLPPMFTFEHTLPVTHEYMVNGPANSINISNSTGRPNSEGYLLYLKHLESFLNQERPIVLFHSGLFPRPRQAIFDFCEEHDIHLVHMPHTTRHLCHPLDEIFQDFRDVLESKYQEAGILMSPAPVDKGKIPILVRFVMQTLVDRQLLTRAFRVTGLYPFSEHAIAAKSSTGSGPVDGLSIPPESEEQVAVAEILPANGIVGSEEVLRCDKNTQTEPVKISPVVAVSPSRMASGREKEQCLTKLPINWSSLLTSPSQFNIDRKVRRDLKRRSTGDSQTITVLSTPKSSRSEGTSLVDSTKRPKRLRASSQKQ